jgi:hypothetical protein
MKKRIFLLLMIACLLLVTTAQARSDRSQPTYFVHASSIAGGPYSLASLNWHFGGTVESQRYVLASPSILASAGSGCCCMFLPCLKK